jgi:hypothetical protein
MHTWEAGAGQAAAAAGAGRPIAHCQAMREVVVVVVVVVVTWCAPGFGVGPCGDGCLHLLLHCPRRLLAELLHWQGQELGGGRKEQR